LKQPKQAHDLISCIGITKRFGSRVAVDGVSLAVDPGEVCALMGPNGAGKSTLLRILCGLLPADAGEIRKPGKRHIGVVPDDLALLPELSIEEQVSMCGPIYGIDLRVTRERTHDLLRKLGLYDVRRTYARECSYGMRKKTALAMALLHGPDVLLLDEPFEGVDQESTEAGVAMLREAKDCGAAVLITTHISPLIDKLGARVLTMRQGKLVDS
jgi:ABC-2 type transport system ATP-binding protein